MNLVTTHSQQRAYLRWPRGVICTICRIRHTDVKRKVQCARMPSRLDGRFQREAWCLFYLLLLDLNIFLKEY